MAAGIAGSAVLAALTVLAAGRTVNADMMVMSVMSIQHPLLFYWGQNRFATFFPLLLSPLKDPHLNLLALMWLHGLCFYLLLLTAALAVVRCLGRCSPTDTGLAFLTMVTVAALTLHPSAFADFAIGPEPYGPSYLLALAAAMLWFGRPQSAAIAKMTAAVLLAVALGFHTGVVLAALAAGAWGFWSGRTGQAVGFVALALVLFGNWQLIAAGYPAPQISYFSFTTADVTEALQASLGSIASGLRLGGAAFVGAAAITVLVALRNRFDRALLAILAGTLSFALTWGAVFAQNVWVAANGYGVRYFFPTLFGLVFVAGAILIAGAILLPQRIKRVAIVGMVAGMTAMLVRPMTPLMDYAALSPLRDEVAFARAHAIRFIAGDYWRVWPAVLALLDAPEAAFGLAENGDANAAAARAVLDAEIKKGAAPVRALCFARDIGGCNDWSPAVLGRRWQLAEEACPGDCLLLTLAEEPAR